MRGISIFVVTVALMVGLIVGMVGCDESSPPSQYDLTISSTVGGSVTTPGEGSSAYHMGTVVSLVAEPEDGYHFVNWIGDVRTITDVYVPTTAISIYGDYEITARFAPGTYNIQVIHTASEGMYQIHSGDIDGDGLPEASILRNTSGSWFVDYVDGDYVLSEVPHSGACVFGDVADTNGNGRAEIIVAGPVSIQIMSYVAPGVFQIDADIPIEGGPRGVIAGGVGHNGSMRIIAGSQSSGRVHVFKYDEGDYVEEWSDIVVPNSQIVPTAVGDVDNDGQAEFLMNVWETPWYGPSNGNIYVYKWTGETYEPVIIQHTEATGHMPAAIADLDQDGKNELVIYTDEITVYKYSSQSGGELERVWSAPGGYSIQIAIGDVDGDGQDEVVYSPHYPPHVHYPGRIIVIGYDGTQYNVKSTITGFPGELGGATVADFDGNGRNEIIASLGNVQAPEHPVFLVTYTPLSP